MSLLREKGHKSKKKVQRFKVTKYSAQRKRANDAIVDIAVGKHNL